MIKQDLLKQNMGIFMFYCQNYFSFADRLGLKLSKVTIRSKKCWEHKGLETALSSIDYDTDAVLFDNRIIIQVNFNCKFFNTVLLRSSLFQFFKKRILI